MVEKKPFSRADARKMATRLRKSEEWSVERVRASREGASESLKRMAMESHSEKQYAETDGCEDCEKERISSGDETALCPTHFDSMMEF